METHMETTITGYIVYNPIVENQMEKRMENEMETGGIQGFKYNRAL